MMWYIILVLIFIGLYLINQHYKMIKNLINKYVKKTNKNDDGDIKW